MANRLGGGYAREWSREAGRMERVGVGAMSDAPSSSVRWCASNSTGPLPTMADQLSKAPSETSLPTHAAANRLTFWLDGSVVMCGCPDCAAPLSVRLWLMTADCWRCGTGIVLTEEEQQAVAQLLGSRGVDEDRQPSQAGAPVDRSPNAAPDWRTALVPADPSEAQLANLPAERDGDADGSEPVAVARQSPRGKAKRSRWLERLLKDTPAWLISLIFHLLLLTILALLRVEEQQRLAITLSATVSHLMREGGENLIAPRQDEVQFDLPLPERVDWTSPRERKALELAAEDARELRLDPDVPAPELPPLDVVRRRLGEPAEIAHAFAARDPRIRVDVVRQEGGTTLTEAAVARGLRWLAQQQSADGSWRLRGYDGNERVESRCSATAMALMAFLGAGQTHLVGRYQEQVSKGLRWLIENQSPDGDLRGNGDTQAGMYAHGQAAIALSEAFAMTGDERLREPAQRAVDFIVLAQYRDGGWRYTPQEPRGQPGGDTSVVGWQLMALQSARAARLTVPAHTLELAGQFLDRVAHSGGSQYGYRPESRPTPAMTAEALLCRIYLGWRSDQPALRDGVRYMVEENLASPDQWNIYYWYYATQVLHHYGGASWSTWNSRIRDILVMSQETKGRHAGSWPPRGAWADAGGRLYVTALAVCTLEVYYRHMPLFRPIKGKGSD